jgi:hypothetical protein
MKTLLFAMTCWLALMSGASYAATTSQPAPDNSGKADEKQSGSGTPDKTKAPDSTTRGVTGPQTHLNGFSGSTKPPTPESPLNNNHSLPLHPGGTVPSIGPLLNNGRHLGSPVIGGPAKTSTASTSAINGTGMKRTTPR